MSVVAGTLASSLLPATSAVNSLHHQTVSEVGDGLVVSRARPTAWSRDWRRPRHDVLAVQWHPELLAKPDPTFQWVVREASKRLSA